MNKKGIRVLKVLRKEYLQRENLKKKKIFQFTKVCAKAKVV